MICAELYEKAWPDYRDPCNIQLYCFIVPVTANVCFCEMLNTSYRSISGILFYYCKVSQFAQRLEKSWRIALINGRDEIEIGLFLTVLEFLISD